jgi:hypothetical protein
VSTLLESRPVPPMIDASLDFVPMSTFGQPEHLLIWTWRRVARGHGQCPLITREFRAVFGEDAGEVLGAFIAFLDALAYASRRKLAVGFPGCSGLTVDEQRVTALLAAAQNDRPALFEAHLTWLARADDRHVMAIGVGALARAFLAHGLCLAPPTPMRPAACACRLAVVGAGATEPTLAAKT